jgi:hypothetical protein
VQGAKNRNYYVRSPPNIAWLLDMMVWSVRLLAARSGAKKLRIEYSGLNAERAKERKVIKRGDLGTNRARVFGGKKERKTRKELPAAYGIGYSYVLPHRRWKTLTFQNCADLSTISVEMSNLWYVNGLKCPRITTSAARRRFHLRKNR